MSGNTRFPLQLPSEQQQQQQQQQSSQQFSAHSQEQATEMDPSALFFPFE